MPLLEHIYRPLTRLKPEHDLGHPVAYLVLVPTGSSPSVYQSLFSKIIERLGGSPERDLHFLQVEGNAAFQYSSLVEGYQFNILILCGLHASNAGLQSSLPLHTPARLGNRHIIRTESPENLEKATVEVKTAFWNCLRSIPTPNQA